MCTDFFLASQDRVLSQATEWMLLQASSLGDCGESVGGRSGPSTAAYWQSLPAPSPACTQPIGSCSAVRLASCTGRAICPSSARRHTCICLRERLSFVLFAVRKAGPVAPHAWRGSGSSGVHLHTGLECLESSGNGKEEILRVTAAFSKTANGKGFRLRFS